MLCSFQMPCSVWRKMNHSEHNHFSDSLLHFCVVCVCVCVCVSVPVGAVCVMFLCMLCVCVRAYHGQSCQVKICNDREIFLFNGM